MPVFRNSNVSHLLPVTLALRELGCGVIPLLGGADGHSGKRPALRWSAYQTRLPYPDELSAWFGGGHFSAYGVVCGLVSRLIVLDLDMSNLADAFAQAFPHLMETLVVTSGLRGTPHVYWRVDFRVESRSFPGGDLKAEGGYVVGPDSIIGGATWRITSDKPIRTITESELSAVLAFLTRADSSRKQPVETSMPVGGFTNPSPPTPLPQGTRGAKDGIRGDLPMAPVPRAAPVETPTPPRERAPAAPVEIPMASVESYRRVALSPSGLVAFYNRLVDSGCGRNKALFTAARRARDVGYSESQTLDALAATHAGARPPAGHPRESRKSRAAEAVRTIKSVFTHPAAVPMPAAGTPVNAPFDSSIQMSLLPNAARERLLARADGAAILRTYEGALLSGIAESALVTESELCQRLAHVVSRKTIRKALFAANDSGEPIFELAKSQQPPQTPPTCVDTGVEKTYRQKNALLSPGQEGTKVAHRPPRHFVMPTIRAICAGLGVKMTLSSPLALADLSSSRGCRQALHLDLLSRRPGVYSQTMLGARLGVTARTIRRYHREMPIHSSKTYDETPISSYNLHRVPSGADIQRMMLNVGGQFLMDSAGDKWPLKREIAAWLLKRGRRVSHMEQKCSFYWVTLPQNRCVGIPTLTPAVSAQFDNAAPVGADLRTNPTTTRVRHAEPLQLPQSPIVAPPGYTQVTVTGESLLIKTRTSLLQMPLFAQEGTFAPRIPPDGGVTCQNAGIPVKSLNPQESKRKYHRSLADERAERLAKRLWATIEDFSLVNARRLVTTYGVEPVEAALKKMLFLQARGRINNPGGFIVTASRVSWRIQNRKCGLGDSAPRFRAEPKGRVRMS